MEERKITITAIEETPDFNEIKDLIIPFWPEQFGALPDERIVLEYEKDYRSKLDRVKYLYVDKRIAGWYRYSKFPREAGAKDVHTYDIAVHGDFQRQGLGLILMKDMIKDSRSLGYEKLLSRSFKNNEGSIRLHRAAGFTEHMKTSDSIVWELDLHAADRESEE
ncbi:MAG: GNAT family N-acetyltransferase [Spirochaetales bacterium]|nr:GNAT family N-acetyltransferase [Spirochaetales bacterium]